MKKILWFAVGLIVFACSENTPVKEKEIVAAQEETPVAEKETVQPSVKKIKKSNSSNPEDELIALIMQLPEVQKLSEEIETKSKNKRHLSLRISSVPSDDQEYYGITVAEDNGLALASYYEFHIYPGNEVRYYDVVEDKEISLDTWRKK